MRDTYVDTDDIYTDGFGHEYESLDEMCSAYGIGRGTYLVRIKAGWDSEEALIIPINSPKIIGRGLNNKTALVKDHLGNTYSSIRKSTGMFSLRNSNRSLIMPDINGRGQR